MDHFPKSPETWLNLRLKLAALSLNGASLKALSRKFDPNQPRVPAGNADGGQWTDGGSRAGASARRPSGQSSRAASAGGTQDWRQIASERLPGGRERRLHRSPDGFRIYAETGAPSAPSATSRYLVVAPDGDRLSVENRDGVQRIFDGQGNLLAATRWGANGPEPVVEPQLANSRLLLLRPTPPALVPPPRPGQVPALPPLTLPVIKYLALVAKLQAYLFAEIQSGVAVAAFRAREFGPSNDDPYGLTFVGAIAVAEAIRFCPRYMEVQNKLTEVAQALEPNFTGSPQSFGIKVHQRVAKYVNSLEEEHFKAEASFDLSGKVLTKREAGSTWLDVYEKVSEDTVCVYDHKTGEAGLSGPRYLALGNTAFRYFRGAKRFIVIELRPGW